MRARFSLRLESHRSCRRASRRHGPAATPVGSTGSAGTSQARPAPHPRHSKRPWAKARQAKIQRWYRLSYPQYSADRRASGRASARPTTADTPITSRAACGGIWSIIPTTANPPSGPMAPSTSGTTVAIAVAAAPIRAASLTSSLARRMPAAERRPTANKVPATARSFPRSARDRGILRLKDHRQWEDDQHRNADGNPGPPYREIDREAENWKSQNEECEASNSRKGRPQRFRRPR